MNYNIELDSLNLSLVALGAVTTDFGQISRLKKQKLSIENGEVVSHRLDCYPVKDINFILKKFTELNLKTPTSMEIFYPSELYPAHRDGGGISYFVPLESGSFSIDNVDYPVVPFVLYAFEDGKFHNTDFCAIMLK